MRQGSSNAVSLDRLDRSALEALQQASLRHLLVDFLPKSEFYAAKLAGINTASIKSAVGLKGLPFTTKTELLADQETHPPYGRNLTQALAHYSRIHQTSGTAGKPLRWLDTPSNWKWMLDCWELLYRIARVQQDDRLFFAFSFGPFLGFWTAFEAASREGYFCLPAGGMSSRARLQLLLENKATIVLCTPTYALRLAEVAREEKIDLASSSVRMLIVAGEPGGSIPATRARIESAWGARVLDHSGLTEVGPVAIECPENPVGLHILESEYIAEVLSFSRDPQGSEHATPTPRGELGELILTNLGRTDSPLLRYRTGDLVRIDPAPCPCGRSLLRLAGGIFGRADDMISIRGNNFYPTALEAIIRGVPEVAEYRVEVDRTGSLARLLIEVEATPEASLPEVVNQVARLIDQELLFKAEVRGVTSGSLPRFEMKSRRVVQAGS